MFTVFARDIGHELEFSWSEPGRGRQVLGRPRSLAGVADALAPSELSFYLEQFLRYPVGGFADRAEAIAGSGLANQGQAMLGALFDDQGPLSALRGRLAVRLREGATVNLVIESDALSVQALPWELVVPCLSDTEVFPQFNVVRSLATYDPDSVRACGSRVLVVICRPAGLQDV